MKTHSTAAIAGLASLLAVVPDPARAGILLYTDRPTFNAQGSILETTDFDDFDPSTFSYPGDPWTRGGVTYTSGRNIVAGAGTGYAPWRNLVCYDYWTPLTASVATAPWGYSMLGFDMAEMTGGRVPPLGITIQVSTTLGTFSSWVTPPESTSGTFAFYGFKTTDPGEAITGFALVSAGSQYAAGITEVTLGVTAVPEPSVYASAAGLGLAGFAAWRRLRRGPDPRTGAVPWFHAGAGRASMAGHHESHGASTGHRRD